MIKLTNPIQTIFNYMKLAIGQYTPLNLMANQLENISNFLRLSELIGTAGQPTEQEFSSIRGASYNLVINLAPSTHEKALPNEQNIVESLHMEYIHIPVAFDRPTMADFDHFCQVLQEHQGQSIFVHCAANLRVSSFMYLYRRIHEGVAPDEAQLSLAQLWVPNQVWQEFIDRTIVEKMQS
jgi:protein tyrosine phosphatase (PTP) superfamily phosphohydrolase (DUF442 family)